MFEEYEEPKLTERELKKLLNGTAVDRTNCTYAGNPTRSYICYNCKKRFSVPPGYVLYKLVIDGKNRVFHSHNCRGAYKKAHPEWSDIKEKSRKKRW